jgi:hypothetical protein
MSSDANPIKDLGLQGIRRKPLGQDLPTIFIPESIGVVVAIKGEGVMQKLSLSEATAKGFIEVEQNRDNHFGTVSTTTIKIKSSRVRLAFFVKP